MNQHSLPLGDADRRVCRSATASCLLAVAALASSAFVYAEWAQAEVPNTSAGPAHAVAPFVLLPTVPQAAEVLPAGPPSAQPDIATHGG